MDEGVAASTSSRHELEGTTEMASNEDTLNKLQDEVKGLEVSQATQAATLAGAQATQAAAHAGTWSTMSAGAVGLVVGIFLGMAIAGSRHRW